MRYFCTYFDQHYLSRGLALYESLRQHADEFRLTILCMDESTRSDLAARKLPEVKLLPLDKLVAEHPELRAAADNRTKLEFFFTCTSWLARHLIPTVPEGELLTYLDADLYFFSSPKPIYDEIGTASVAITPHRFPPALQHLDRYGRFNVGWVSFRNDHTGIACASDWAEKCADWCYNRLEDERYADQKYLDTWETRFSPTVSIKHRGVNAAPWNVRDSRIREGPCVDDVKLVFYHFHALRPVAEQLYDPSLHRYDADLSEGLRRYIYLPYLQHLLRLSGEIAGPRPEVLPAADPLDPRHASVVTHLLQMLKSSELDRGKRLLSIEENVRATKQTIAYLETVERDRNKARAEHQQTVDYLKTVEKDSEERLASIHYYQDKLKTAYADLERNVAYLKTLEAEIRAHIKVGADKDAIIADLTRQLQKAR